MMKGQIYLVTAIFIVIMLVFLRASISDMTGLEKDQFYHDFQNLKQEYVHIAHISALNSENISDNLESFSSFAETYYQQKGINHTLLYNASQTSSDISVDIYIYLGNDKSYLSDSFMIERVVY